MNLSTVRTLALSVPLIMLAASNTAVAQYPGYAPQQGGYPVQQAYHAQAGMQPQMVAPVGFNRGCNDGSCGGACGQGGYGGCYSDSFGGACGPGGCGYGGYGGCNSCDGNGCSACCGSMGPVGRFFYYLFTAHGPQGDGAFCKPRYYDIQFEIVSLNRDDTSTSTINYFSGGNVSTPPNIVLSTDNLDFSSDVGVSLVGNYMISANTFVEARWLGAFEFSDSASVDSVSATGLENNLFSAFSAFGTDPDNMTQTGFPEVDNADSASISYNSKLNSGEVNIRRRWVTNNSFLHYSLFMGARYVKLDESFNLSATVLDPADQQIITGRTDYNLRTQNDLVGFQMGGDLLFNIAKRIRLGGDFKAGIFGNQATTRANILLQEEDSMNPGTLADATIVIEDNQKAEAAFVGEAAIYALVNITDRWTVRGGYEVFYLNNVALATENFNPDATLVSSSDGLRGPFINNTGDAFYSGFTGGFEYTW